MALRRLFGSLSLVVLVLTLSDTLGAEDCYARNLTGSPGELTLSNHTNPANVTCYQFSLYNVTGGVFLNINREPEVQHVNIRRITVLNINPTGDSSVASNRSFDTDSPPTYYVVVGNATSDMGREIVRVIVYIQSPVLDQPVTIGSFNNISCKGLFPELPDQLSSPDYQRGLALNFSCVYSFMLLTVASDDRLPVLEFTEFSFQAPSHLTIDDEKHSGDDLPPDFIVPENFSIQMNINAENNDSFSASVTLATKGCTSELVIGSGSVLVESPGYQQGHEYTNNLMCKQVIKSNDTSKRLEFRLSDIELAVDMDSVVLIDGGASRSVGGRVMARLSAIDQYMNQDALMVSSGSAVLVKFTTDELGTAKGFSFNATQTEVDGRYQTPSAVSFAPTLSQPQEANMMIVAPLGSLIELSPDLLGGVHMSPTSSVKCYEGNSSTSPLIASYRSEFKMFAAYSSDHRMLCVASEFNVNSDKFNASALTVSVPLNKFSFHSSGVYILNARPGVNVTYNWIVQPDDFTADAIELTINELSFHTNVSQIFVRIFSMKEKLYASLSPDTPLPYRIRVPKSRALRLSVGVASTGGSSASPISLSASYKLDSYTKIINSSKGSIKSPYYPKGTPERTVKNWLIHVPVNKSLQLSFSGPFELTNNSFLSVYLARNESSYRPGNETFYSNTSGPTLTAPFDVLINNTLNRSMTVGVYLRTAAQSLTSGVEIFYTVLDSGYSAKLGIAPQVLKTPGYPAKLNTSFRASWVISVDKNNSKGLVELVKAAVSFTHSNSTKLELRDGPNADSPLLGDAMTMVSRSLTALFTRTYTVTTSSNYLYVSYAFVKSGVNDTGSPLTISVSRDVCSNASQCLLRSNETVCMPHYWKCDGKYQCLDGKDETGCSTPTTKSPAVTKEGAKWWVVALCILAGIVLGVILTVVIITQIMRRRTRGYNRLSELMTPVPT